MSDFVSEVSVKQKLNTERGKKSKLVPERQDIAEEMMRSIDKINEFEKGLQRKSQNFYSMHKKAVSQKMLTTESVQMMSKHTQNTNQNAEKILKFLNYLGDVPPCTAPAENLFADKLEFEPDTSNRVREELEKTNKDIKILNNEISRLVASQMDTYIMLEHNVDRYIDVLDKIPILCKVSIENIKTSDEESKYLRLQLPVSFTI